MKRRVLCCSAATHVRNVPTKVYGATRCPKSALFGANAVMDGCHITITFTRKPPHSVCCSTYTTLPNTRAQTAMRHVQGAGETTQDHHVGMQGVHHDKPSNAPSCATCSEKSLKLGLLVSVLVGEAGVGGARDAGSLGSCLLNVELVRIKERSIVVMVSPLLRTNNARLYNCEATALLPSI